MEDGEKSDREEEKVQRIAIVPEMHASGSHGVDCSHMSAETLLNQ